MRSNSATRMLCREQASTLSTAGLKRSLMAGALLVGCAFAWHQAQAAEPTAQGATANSKYERDRARCLSGASQQDQATCLREAGAAREARKDGDMAKGSPDKSALHDNALDRCKDLPAADKADCISRVNGEGIKEGSVGGGGVIKETVTTRVLPRGAQVPPGETQVGTIPAAVIPAPPAMGASGPK